MTTVMGNTAIAGCKLRHREPSISRTVHPGVKPSPAPLNTLTQCFHSGHQGMLRAGCKEMLAYGYVLSSCAGWGNLAQIRGAPAGQLPPRCTPDTLPALRTPAGGAARRGLAAPRTVRQAPQPQTSACCGDQRWGPQRNKCNSWLCSRLWSCHPARVIPAPVCVCVCALLPRPSRGLGTALPHQCQRAPILPVPPRLLPAAFRQEQRGQEPAVNPPRFYGLRGRQSPQVRPAGGEPAPPGPPKSASSPSPPAPTLGEPPAAAAAGPLPSSPRILATPSLQ